MNALALDSFDSTKIAMKINLLVRYLRLFVRLLAYQSSFVVASATSKLRKMKMTMKKMLLLMESKQITERLLSVEQSYSLTKEKQPFLITKRNLGLIRL